MKIAYLLKSVSRQSGGLFDSCRRLAQTISCWQNIIVLGVTDEFTGADVKEWTPLQPKIFHAVGPRNFGYAPGYAQALASAAPDMVHVHGLWTYHSLAGYLWHRRTGRPLMYTAHGMFDPWALRNSGWRKRTARVLWEDAAHRSAACFHALSRAEYRAFRACGLRNPVCVIPNGVDLPRPAESPEFGTESLLFKFAQDRKILLYLGRLHPKKNLASLLRAWKQTLSLQPSTISSWILAIAGWDQGGHENELRRLAREIGPSFTQIRTAGAKEHQTSNGASVVFLGPQFGPQKGACYRACDAFILPSLSEGLPMTVLEAWTYAKPVLMTPECNLPEGFAAGAALRIGTTSNEIAAGLGKLLEMNDSERQKMGACGRTLVAKKFSWPQIGQQMGAVYEWVLGGGLSPETVRFD